MTFRRVVLPEPLGPRMVTNSPAATLRLTSKSAATWPKRLLAASTCRRPDCCDEDNARSSLMRRRAGFGPHRSAAATAISAPSRRRSRLGQHPFVPAFPDFRAVDGPPFLVEPDLLLEIVGIQRQQRPYLFRDILIGVEMHAGIAEDLGIGRLPLRIAHDRQRLHRPILILGALRHYPTALFENAAVPLHHQRRFFTDQIVEAAVPAGRQ